MAKIKVGFIGCGGIANSKHFPGMAQEENIEMAAFCDLIPERADCWLIPKSSQFTF